MRTGIGSILVLGMVLLMAYILFTPSTRDALIDTSSLMRGKDIVEKPRNEVPAEDYNGYFERYQIPVGRRTYTYFWYSPDKPWPEGLKFPLVLILHGAPGKAYAAKWLITDPTGMKHPAFILIPALSIRRHWAAPSKTGELPKRYALGDIIEIVKQVSTLYPVDTKRIYVVGCSDGGTGVYGAARYFPDVFAAGIAMSGSWDPADGVNMTKMPLLAMHGALDQIIPPDQAKALNEIIRSRGGNAFYNEFPEMGHQCPSEDLYADKIWDWMFGQKRS